MHAWYYYNIASGNRLEQSRTLRNRRSRSTVIITSRSYYCNIIVVLVRPWVHIIIHVYAVRMYVVSADEGKNVGEPI